MKKRFLAFILCVFCAFSLFIGCDKTEKENLVELPIAEPNPDITKPEGSFYEASGKQYADGGLSALGDDFIRIMIKGEEIEFEISDVVIRKIGIFNNDKNNLKIKRGTILSLQYEIENEKYIAKDIEIIDAN